MKEKLTKKQIEEFKNLLLQKRDELVGSVDKLSEEALHRGRLDVSGDLSNLPSHIADMSSDVYSQDVSLGLMESEQKMLIEINLALEKIEKGTYQICEKCQELISIQRLKAIPYARFCLKCQSEQEKQEESS